jgi:YVTN family beta-propeller protein
MNGAQTPDSGDKHDVVDGPNEVLSYLSVTGFRKRLFSPALENNGEVFLYLQPMPQESHKLRFVIDAIAARHIDGSDIHLSLAVTELSGTALIGVQKLLASEYLSPGLYRGLSIKIKTAYMLGEEGEAALHVVKDPIIVTHQFRVTRKRATTLFLTLEASRALTDGVIFTPGFSLTGSTRQLINLTGYVSNTDSNTISIFNKKTMRIAGVIASGKGPKGMVLDQRRRRIYVALAGDDAIAVIDALEGKIINRLSLNFGDKPTDLALAPDGRTLVAVNHDSNTISIIDAISLFEADRIKVGERPTSAVINPAGSLAFITNSLSNTVSVVDLNRKVPIATLAVEAAPTRASFNQNGDKLYVINRNSTNLTVIDPSRLIVSEKIFAGIGAISIEVDRQTGLIYIGKRFGREVSIIAPRLLMFIDTIEARGSVTFLTIDNEENSLFAVLQDKKVLQKINLTSKRIVSEIEVGKGAYAVVVMGEQ